MSCDFCKKIWISKEEYTKQFKYPDDEHVAIVFDYDNKPSLYIPIEDWYYSDTYLQVDYCPKCGRKLKEE